MAAPSARASFAAANFQFSDSSSFPGASTAPNRGNTNKHSDNIRAEIMRNMFFLLSEHGGNAGPVHARTHADDNTLSTTEYAHTESPSGDLARRGPPRRVRTATRVGFSGPHVAMPLR